MSFVTALIIKSTSDRLLKVDITSIEVNYYYYYYYCLQLL